MGCIKCGGELPGEALFCPWCGKKQAQEKRKALKRANGTGTVYKLSGRRKRPWAAAKNKVVIGYYERKTDALEALERLSGKDVAELYNMTFMEVYEAWSLEHFREIGKNGIVSYKNAYKIFEPLHSRKFRELRTADYQQIIDNHCSKSHSSLNKYKQLISQMGGWAIREEICTTNFAKYVKIPAQKKKEKEIFTDSDIKKLEEDGSPAAKVALMMVYTGMRIGELFALPVSDCHGTYVVGGEKTEAGRNQVIPIRPEGRRYFDEMAAHAAGDLLISGYDGQKVAANYRKRDYYPMLDRLGIERKTPHAARHTFASWAASAGIKPELLQKILGHADYNTTANIYIHTNIEQLVKAVEV